MQAIEDILDKYTGGKLYAEVGSPENNYAHFKHRYEMFKEIIKRDIPELTTEEIIKFHKYFHKFKEIYNWNGFDLMLRILEIENYGVKS